ncbi:ArnT family glycosyltransferase [Calothrix sp. PCC 6303]|uniref:ArnT family glycosyltransferase n=1 Tax=Calothrix sp. PCC 6303 TaxID=1170562 RepID=UPI0002A0101B|nr:glycosyltransferase family 39 protein [Calothrix sp. PCC 6303]AFZ00920.1 glycosyl transferase family 39 [Calothrix sp. PCC 6303]
MKNRGFEQFFRELDKRPVLAVMLSVLWLAVFGGIGFFLNLGSVGLVDETEPLFAEASRQMLVRGDWITPFFNNQTRFDKPALIYWCQAIAYSILGVNEWAVRLPSAIAAMVVVGLSFYVLQWYQLQRDNLTGISSPTKRWVTAAFCGAVICFTPEMIIWGRTGVSDMLLTGCIASGLFCFFLGYATSPEENRKKTNWYMFFYIFVAGAILTKGPVGIVLPGLIIAAFLLYVGKLREVMGEMHLILGTLTILVLAAPWYILVTWRNGWSFINSFFLYHNVERFTSVVNRHSAPWYFYFLVVLLLFAPYSVYLPIAIARLKFWRRSWWSSQTRSHQLPLFAVFWFLGVFGFFTVSITKLPSYVLPLMPAAAILIALLWAELLPNSSDAPNYFWLRVSGWVNVAFIITLGVVLFYVPQMLGSDPALPNFGEALQKSNLTTIGGVIWLVCGLILAFFVIRRQWVTILGVNLAAFSLFLLIVITPALFLLDEQRQLPLRQLSAIALQNKQPQDELVMVGFKKPSVVFYTGRSVNYIRTTPGGKDYINSKTTNQLASLLLITQSPKIPQMGLQPKDYTSLGKSGVYELVRLGKKQ